MEYALITLYIAGWGISWHQWMIIRRLYNPSPVLTWRGKLAIALWPIHGIKLCILYPWGYLIARLQHESVPEVHIHFATSDFDKIDNDEDEEVESNAKLH